MGNQLTGIAPSQILPVDHYLTDLPDYEYQSSLGSTRFFKVARARCREGPTVVKVFVIHDPSLPLKHYKDQIEDIGVRLLGAPNCLPFQKSSVSDKAALLYRQYVKDSLYDRISTRPFLNPIEKKWLAFQLLCALNQCHHFNICHGDIKSENVMVTSWNWLLLTDFASFKPTYLPEDNPSDFSYFFDTSRRRTCYIAPERFVESSWKNTEQDQSSIDLTTSEIKKGDLTPAMDIFSAGCVIAELFTEGSPPFDLSQLLEYRSKEYSPWKLLEKIDDTDIRELVRHMLQKEQSLRLSAEEYLRQQNGKAFPEYFFTFLKLYMQRYAISPILSSDDRVARLKRDFNAILENLGVSESEPKKNSSLVLIISLLTASLRDLKYCKSKLTCLELMLNVTKYVTSDVILDRLLPFMLSMVSDPFAQVRSAAVRTITLCLADVQTVPISDANVFPEYVLPALTNLTQDSEVQVRVAYAENIALLAETALRFLEIVQISTTSESQSADSAQTEARYKASYDVELQALHEMIQQKVVTLLCDPDNVVKQALLENGITRLCVFFGRQKASDVLLSHMITFLNDKHDWNLRGAFFDSIVGVAAYVGWQSSSILKPLLQQGLSDPEEFVIHKTLKALTALTELGLLQKPVLHELLAEIVPFLCHPGMWIRQGAAGFVVSVAKSLNVADVHCNLVPLVQPFLKQPVVQMDSEVVLLSSLKPPVSRSVYDYIVRSPLMEKLLGCLHDRKLMRNICRSGHKPNYGEMDERLTQMFRKLVSQGMTEADEEKLLSMKDFIVKLHRSRAGSSESSDSLEEELSKRGGEINLSHMGKSFARRHADLMVSEEKWKENLHTPTKKTSRKHQTKVESPTISMNEDWKQMFGHSADLRKGQVVSVEKSKFTTPDPAQASAAAIAARLTGSPSKPPASPQTPPSPAVGAGPGPGAAEQGAQPTPPQQETVQPRQTTPAPVKHVQPPSGQVPIDVIRYANCKLELRNIVSKKREQFGKDQMCKDARDAAALDNLPPPANWRPKGQLVAHLHEHRGAVNRIQVSTDHSFFATCSNDGTVKIWDCGRMEGKSVTNRSRQTYNKQGGQIKSIAFCDQQYSIASASDSGAIHVFRIETSSPRINILHTKNLDVERDGLVVDINHLDNGAQSVLTYATVNGLLVGWDLRSPKTAWRLKNDPKHGLVTSFDVHHSQSWIGLGTSSGTHVCWDMRFQLPITTVTHPSGARVRRLLAHRVEQSWIISSCQGNNEVSMWNMETGGRQRTLWGSSVPALSTTQASTHSINGLYQGVTDSNTFLLCAGSDMRIRYWDIDNPAKSYIVAGAANDPGNQAVVSYRSRMIDGTDVTQEMYGKARNATNDDIPRRGPDTPSAGHHDIITDINICQTSQCFIITSSRDGVVKVWK